MAAAAAEKWFSVGTRTPQVSFFDPDAADEQAVVTLFAPHARPVSSLHFDSHDSAKLYSSSYDNTVRCFDAGAGKFLDTFTGDGDGPPAFTASCAAACAPAHLHRRSSDAAPSKRR